MPAAIPWHRRMEARALAGAATIVGLSLVALTLVTGTVVSSHTVARAESDLAAAHIAFTHLVDTRTTLIGAQTRLITGLPVFRAHMTDSRLAADRPTMEAMADGFREDLSAAFTIVSDGRGRWLAATGVPDSAGTNGVLAPIVGATTQARSLREIVVLDGTLYFLVAEPAMFGDEVLGALTTGYALDDRMARELAETTGREVALVAGNRISGSSLPAAARDGLGTLLDTAGNPFARAGDVSVNAIGPERYVSASFPLQPIGTLPSPGRLILMDSWAPTERFIDQIRARLLETGAAIFALALGVSLLLSRRMSRPLRELAEAAGEIAQGHWDRRLPPTGSAEAMAMSGAFNDMTVSLSHWHAQAAERTEQLQAAYERYYAVTQSAHDAIVSTDRDGAIIFWHHRAEVLFGLSEQAAVGRAFTTLLAPTCQERYSTATRELTSGAAGAAQALTFDGDGVRGDGAHFPLELSLASWSSGGHLCLTAVIRDVTERHKAEETLRQRDQQLREAQKMDAIGRLASGIAHDFNNSLMVIQGHAEMLAASLDAGDLKRRQKIEVIVQATVGAASITRRLLTFGRKQVSDTKTVDPRELVTGAQKVLGRLLGDNIGVVSGPAGEAGYIRIDPDQLDQVIMNLAINARDAMPDGGELRFDVRTGAEQVTIAVRDSGCGMDPETAARIFEPFFTTKEAGRGTGLGLSIVYGIITQANGTIELETTPGQGTTFLLHLPRVAAPAGTAVVEPMAVLERGTETVLIAEDKPLVRRILRKALEGAGYTVLEAENGEQALTLAESHPGSIDLLLTDIVMPGAGGFALCQALLAVRPATKTVFMSGHPPGSSAREQVDASGWPCLQKPFSIETLARELRIVLDAQRAA